MWKLVLYAVALQNQKIKTIITMDFFFFKGYDYCVFSLSSPGST